MNLETVEKDSLGSLKYQVVSDSAVTDRENYNKGEVKDFMDDDDEAVEYNYGKTSLVSKNPELLKEDLGQIDYFGCLQEQEDLKMKTNLTEVLDLDAQ